MLPLSLAQFTVSWMYDKQGLRLLIDGLGPGYAVEVNTLRSPLEIVIGGEAAAEVADAELALEKSTASQGLLAIHPNEPDLYGYVEEWQDLLDGVMGKAVGHTTVQAIPHTTLRLERAAEIGAWHASAHP